jgi:hypothetical protein
VGGGVFIMSKKTSAHIRYKTTDGKAVPGVTTITGQLAKPQLIPWANKLGLAGIDVKRFVDDKASIGTLAHAMVVAHLIGTDPCLKDYTQNQIDQAENCLLSYYEWEKDKTIEVIVAETPMVSDTYRYGGTPDILAAVDGKPTLIDLKTGKAIYDEHAMQVAAYENLISEVEDIWVESRMILRIGRDEDEGFEVKMFHDRQINKAWRQFMALLDYYHIAKEKA